jgi:predicted nuclease with TOPRIM domain
VAYDELQNLHNSKLEQLNKLQSLNTDLTNNISDTQAAFEKQKVLITSLEYNQTELEEELEASEDQRESLKIDVEEANNKIIELEESLFSTKTI